MAPYIKLHYLDLSNSNNEDLFNEFNIWRHLLYYYIMVS